MWTYVLKPMVDWCRGKKEAKVEDEKDVGEPETSAKEKVQSSSSVRQVK